MEWIVGNWMESWIAKMSTRAIGTGMESFVAEERTMVVADEMTRSEDFFVESPDYFERLASSRSERNHPTPLHSQPFHHLPRR